ncbi:MAG: tellurium resistance protein, partial [Methylococcaceae bacterium]|nr:tellurium resistance protein [Methylococcaceae bacterium]
MYTFIKGQRVKIADITNSTTIEVSLNISFSVSKVIDFSCFGVDQSNKLSDDRYFIFYNQKQSPDNALE